MTVTVRRAGPGDAPALAEAAAATFALACPPHTTAASIAAFIGSVLSEEAFEGYLADPARVLLLAEDGAEQGPALGYAMLVAGEPADADARAAVTLRPTVELSKIYVRLEAHRSGAGPALMAAALDEARATGAAGVWLGVNQLNERAQRFYGKQGFSVVGRKRFLVGESYEDDFVLERPLKDALTTPGTP